MPNFTRLSLTTISLVLLFSGGAQAFCPVDSIDVIENYSENGVTLTAVNKGEAVVTFTIDLTTRNFQSPAQSIITDSLAAQESMDLITLTPRKDGDEPHFKYKVLCTVGNMHADHDDSMVYLLPYASGVSYRVLQGYGARFSHRGHEEYAVDFNMPEGTPVHAARSGVVAHIEESNSRGCWQDGCGRYANFVVIMHDDGTTGEYYHLRKNGALVEPGNVVDAGQLIGLSGNTGHSTMPHLHFGVYRASARGRDQSIPVRFMTDQGILNKPRSGNRYIATSAASTAQNGDNGLSSEQASLD